MNNQSSTEIVLLGQLRRTLGRLEAALGSVEDALALTDFQGLVEWTNRAFDRLVARPRLHSLGKPIDELLPQRFVEGQPGPVFDLLGRARNRSGRTVWDLSPVPPRKVVEVSWSPVNLQPDPSLVFVFRDLSDITRIQDELTDSRDSLEKQVASRTLELRQARDEALAATGEMSVFLSTISHEIRTPLNAIIGLTDVLMDTSLSPNQSELVHTIHTSGELLLRLINDILDLSKIEAKKLSVRLDPFSIGDLVGECARIMDASIQAKGLTLEVLMSPELPVEFQGDSLRIRQILLNLINNAIKFTDDGFVRVELSYQPLKGKKGQVVIKVIDSGHGVSPEFIPKMFKSFSQEHGRLHHSSQLQGTGLGLTICDRLCRLMGGTIQVESEIGKGTCFTVSLPLLHTGDSASSGIWKDDHRSPTQTYPSVSILVAEDNRINQRVLELLLKKLNQHAEFVCNGQQAVERVLQGGIDMVFMDLQMPDVDGLQATRLLRASSIDQPYIIALTAFAFGDHESECIAAGMNDFLNKPVRPADLRLAFDRFCLWKDEATSPNQQTFHERQ
ncbi:ATP-binding protein [Cyanobium gracile]|uniref:histidine kinase n=1 Tax=Cyanobium gracile UHCC 0281 TaxID=3110309 RepID=A0ABU5T0B8_9CYAN|nr:ATP-binding protein [Cyanobium gracile]MEA5443727.1 ATP-binding protein [Cyanobium gracile UHCC 0281]